MLVIRDGVASLNDMKDMLASLPQYQEQREKVSNTFYYSLLMWALILCDSSQCI